MKWRPIFIGQVLALLNAASGICSDEVISAGLNIPVFQMCVMYFCLWVLYTPVLVSRRLSALRPKSLWKFLLAGIFDSQANSILILSFQFTSLTSAFILLNCSLMWVVLLSLLFLKRSFSRKEYLGVLLSVLGILCIVLSDLQSAGWKWSGSILGDCMALLASFLFALSNIWQEYIMTSGFYNFEFLALLGLFGMSITAIESFSYELEDITSIHSWQQILSILGFEGAVIGFYSISPFYFQAFGATIFNMSLLTGVAYALIFSILAYGQALQWLFFLGYGFVISGIVIYNYLPSAPREQAVLMEDIKGINKGDSDTDA